MTIQQLIDQLQSSKWPSDTEVLIYDPESDDLYTITGYLYDPRNNTLELCTDDNE